jgi:hypothetical protein
MADLLISALNETLQAAFQSVSFIGRAVAHTKPRRIHRIEGFVGAIFGTGRPFYWELNFPNLVKDSRNRPENWVQGRTYLKEFICSDLYVPGVLVRG